MLVGGRSLGKLLIVAERKKYTDECKQRTVDPTIDSAHPIAQVSVNIESIFVIGCLNTGRTTLKNLPLSSWNR